MIEPLSGRSPRVRVRIRRDNGSRAFSSASSATSADFFRRIKASYVGRRGDSAPTALATTFFDHVTASEAHRCRVSFGVGPAQVVKKTAFKPLSEDVFGP
jgi:hypothetical protein